MVDKTAARWQDDETMTQRKRPVRAIALDLLELAVLNPPGYYDAFAWEKLIRLARELGASEADLDPAVLKHAPKDFT